MFCWYQPCPCLTLAGSPSIPPDGCQSTLDLSQRVRDTAAQVRAHVPMCVYVWPRPHCLHPNPMINQQEQFIDLQEDLIAISECTKRLAEERRRIMVRGVLKQIGWTTQLRW